MLTPRLPRGRVCGETSPKAASPRDFRLTGGAGETGTDPTGSRFRIPCVRAHARYAVKIIGVITRAWDQARAIGPFSGNFS